MSFLVLLHVSGDFKRKKISNFFQLIEKNFDPSSIHVVYLPILLTHPTDKKMPEPLPGLGPSLGLFLPSQGLALEMQCIILIKGLNKNVAQTSLRSEPWPSMRKGNYVMVGMKPSAAYLVENST